MKEIDEKDLVEITGGGIGDKLLNIELEKPSDGSDGGGSIPGLRDRASDGGAGSNTGTDSTGSGNDGGNSAIN